MSDPKLQRSRFDQVMTEASWELARHDRAVRQTRMDGSLVAVSTRTLFIRDFDAKQDFYDIIRRTRNLVRRASVFARITDYTATLNVPAHDPVVFPETPA